MNPLSETSKVKTMFVLLGLCVIGVFAGTAQAYDYRAEFVQMAGWLATQQITSGGNLGGIKEGEDNTVVQTDNTAEAIWIWSRYAELTGDYTTYITNINNAWTYCNNFPSWLESGTPTNYYNTYNVGWGLLAEMKYRQVYLGRPEYVNHTSYGTSCANHLVNNTPGTSTTTDALCLGIASGSLYQYGVNVSSATYKNRAVVLGGNVRTWLNGSTSRFASEGWAVSGGIAVWGVLNSYYEDPNYSGGAATWAGTANTYMPLNAADGLNNTYEYGHDGWFAWGHYAVSEQLGSGSFTKYQNIIDLLLASDGDNDGGIRQGPTFANTSDYAWSTNCMQFASNLGLISLVNYTISGTVTSGGSGLAGVTMSGLPGNPVTNASGVYSAQVGSGWSGTVTPTMTGYTFTPATRTYSNVTSNQTAQDYTATPALPGKATTPSPANTATNVSLTADLGWTAGSGATSHIVYFGTTSPGTLQGEQAGTTFDTGTMSNNTTYYWRIDEKNAAGITTGDVWSFTTVPAAPGAATAPSPANTATNVGVTTDLGWTAGSGATSHIVYFGTSSPGTLRGEQAGTTYDTGTMSANTTYYWRIDEKNAGGTTTGTVWSFTTELLPPGQATSPNPANTATNVSLTADLGWTAGSGATSHIVYFGTTSPGTLQGEQAGTTFDTGTMNTNTTYYWRIDEKNAAGTTTGVVWSFTTVPPPPAQAANPNPSDLATSVSVTADLSWTAGSGATSHDVYFGTTSPGTFRGNQAGTTYDTGTMSANTTYYWRIDEKNAGGTTTGIVWSFTTQTAPPLLPWSDGFESGNFTAGGWTVLNASATVATAAAHTGTYGAKLAKDTWIEKAISTAGFNSIHILYDRITSGYDAGEYLYVEWSIDGTNWIQLEATQETSWASKDLTCDPNANNNLNFRIRFRTNASAGNEYTYLDSVQITGTAIVQPERTLTSSSTDGGNVTTPGEGAFQYAHGTVVNLVATADVHYHFVNWTGTAVTAGKVASPTSATTTVTMDGNYTVVANFAIDTFTLGYSAGTNGSLTGETSQVVDYNTSGTAVEAVPNTGYHFVDWSDSSTANPRTDTNVTANIAVTANFAIDTFTLGYSAGTNGSLTGETSQVVDYNTSGTAVEAVPNTGYHFVNWSDSSTANPRTDTNVTANIAVTANFAIDTFTLGYSAGAGGILTGETSQVVDYNTSGTAVEAVPNTGYHFVDWSDSSTDNPRTDTNVTANIAVTANFAIDQMTIFGYITEPDANIPVEGVSIDANNGGGSDATDVNGYYELTVDYGWSGAVDVNKTGYTFEPNGMDYNNVTTDQTNQNYTATLLTYVISGYVLDSNDSSPIDGVLMSGLPGDPCTNGSGYYSAVVDYGWSGTVTPTKYAYAFEPNSIEYANVTADQTGQDYAGTLLTYSVSGCILDLNDIPIDGVLVSANNGGGLDTTDPNGYYEVWVSYNWSGTVTPTDEEYTFAPANRPYGNVLADQTNQDYVGTSIYDLYPDGIIDWLDLDVLCENWLTAGPGDFDNDGTVDFRDFAEFALVW